MTRYAIYWAPEETHPLWLAGSSWLGRDARSGVPSGCAHEATEEPRRYGFHATLKAPITLRRGREPAQFVEAVRSLAERHRPFSMPELQMDWLCSFLALQAATPVDATHPLRQLADSCVRDLDTWRAPFETAELSRRSAGLDAGQRGLLAEWGSPYVFDCWRFHMTLSCGIPSTDCMRRQLVLDSARSHFERALAAAVRCESLCVFIEIAKGRPFVLAHRFPLGP